MNRRVSLVIGVVLVLIGIVWTLQGLDILGGSGMSGVGIWAVIGPFVALIGVVVALGARRRTRRVRYAVRHVRARLTARLSRHLGR